MNKELPKDFHKAITKRDMDNRDMNKETIKIEIIKGVEGLAIYVNDYRVCGNKPWGGGTLVKSWNIRLEDFGDLLKKANQEELLKKIEGIWNKHKKDVGFWDEVYMDDILEEIKKLIEI